MGQVGPAGESGRRAAHGGLGDLSIGTTFWAYNAIVPAVAHLPRPGPRGVPIGGHAVGGREQQPLGVQLVDLAHLARRDEPQGAASVADKASGLIQTSCSGCLGPHGL